MARKLWARALETAVVESADDDSGMAMLAAVAELSASEEMIALLDSLPDHDDEFASTDNPSPARDVLDAAAIEPLQVDPRPAAEIVGAAPDADIARLDTDPAIVAVVADGQGVVDAAEPNEVAVVETGKSGSAVADGATESVVAERAARSIKRYQLAVGVLCAAAALILVVFGTITYRAQKQADRADARADRADARAAQVIKKVRTSPVYVEVELGNEIKLWKVTPNEPKQQNGMTMTVLGAE